MTSRPCAIGPPGFRRKELNGGAIYALAYSYDANGLVRSRADSLTGRHERFHYDELHRLHFWYLDREDGARNTEFDYDELGNLTKVLVNGQTTEENQYGGPGAGPHALTSTRYGSFTYDARGRRTDGRGQHIDYTELDLPREITTLAGASTFGYDASGTRVKKAGPSGTTISIGGLYERRTDPQGGRKHVFYIQGSEGVIAQRIVDEGAGASTTQYLFTDALGSVGVATDDAGKEIDRYYFDPFGQRIDEPGRPLRTSPADMRIGYTGHSHDDELGLIDMRGRMYDPATRRFLTPDPIVPLPLFGQSYNAYSYALNSPINLVDPTGFEPWGGSTGSTDGPPGLFSLLPGWFRFFFHYSSGDEARSGAGDEYGRRSREREEYSGGGDYRGGGGSSRITRSGHQAPKPSPAPTDSRGRELPSTSSPGAAGSGTGFALVSYQDDSADQSGGAEAEQAQIDAFNVKFGMVTGVVGSMLIPTPLAPVGGVLLCISGVTGLYEIKSGIETRDLVRAGLGAFSSITMFGRVSQIARLGAELGVARGAVPRSVGAAAASSDATIAAHAANHWPNLTQEQLIAKIGQVRQTGTTIIAPNGNKLTYVKDGTILIEDATSLEGGTIFRPDNLKRFVNKFLGENQ